MKSPSTTQSTMAMLKVNVCTFLDIYLHINNKHAEHNVMKSFWMSHRSSSEAGGHGNVGLSSWAEDVSGGEKKWPGSIWASNRSSGSGHDMGKRDTEFLLPLYCKKSSTHQQIKKIFKHYVCCKNMCTVTFHCQGMFAIGWLELGESEKAQHLLEKCFNNIQGPFQVSVGLKKKLPHNANMYWVSVPLLSGVEWIIWWHRCSKLPHGHGRIPAGCAVWLYWFQVC